MNPSESNISNAATTLSKTIFRVLYFLFVLAVSNYGSGLFNYFFWQKSLVELITSGSAGTWPVLFRNTVDFRPGHCSVVSRFREKL